MPIDAERFGELPSGEAVTRYTLTNDQGLTVKIINFGGIITELLVPDRTGQTADVVLGLSSLQEYLNGHPYFGAVVGRVAGRIGGGSFSIDDHVYELVCNNPPNHLHGGIDGLDKKLWAAKADQTAEGEPVLSLSCTSQDGEEGYPGNITVDVTYTLTQQNALRIEYSASSDRSTPLSLTNHSYFNLAGEGSGSIAGHILQIHTDKYVPAAEDLTLLGRVESVTGTPIDFTQAKPIGEIIIEPLAIHGDNYLIRQDRNLAVVPVATVIEPDSGRVMEVFSSAACLQFYTGKFLGQDNLVGKSGRSYGPYDALCLECHGYPDGVNTPEIDDIILQPDETYSQLTEYRFSLVT